MDVLRQRSLSLFTALGGWRTAAEAVASQVVFLVAYQLTERVSTSALIAVGAVLVFAVVRVCTDGKYWSAAAGLVVVGVSALLAGRTGNAVDFYLQSVLTDVVAAAVCLASMLVGWPMVGLVVGGFRGERSRWRRDRERRRRYQLCTAVFLAKFGIATVVQVPLYLAALVTPLGIASTLLSAPAAGVCIYLTWRILHAQADPAVAAPTSR